jgi:hypothetical protein
MVLKKIINIQSILNKLFKDLLPEFNETYMQKLGQLYDRWRHSIETKQFFQEIQVKKFNNNKNFFLIVGKIWV